MHIRDATVDTPLAAEFTDWTAANVLAVETGFTRSGDADEAPEMSPHETTASNCFGKRL